MFTRNKVVNEEEAEADEQNEDEVYDRPIRPDEIPGQAQKRKGQPSDDNDDRLVNGTDVCKLELPRVIQEKEARPGKRPDVPSRRVRQEGQRMT